MKIAVWRTGHEIADTVAEVINASDMPITSLHPTSDVGIANFPQYDCHIAYGILRGTDEVFKRAESIGKPWFNIDRGYWKPNHYDGYYRVSLRGTQQTNLANLKPDYDRLEQLGLEILEPIERKHLPVMLCPPTDYACQFFGIDPVEWEEQNAPEHDYFIRQKDDLHDLQSHLDGCSKVITFNSAVGWEALRQGIEVVSDPVHSIVGSHQKLVDKQIHDDLNGRKELFALMAGLQLQLSEVKRGQLWPLLHKLLNL